MTTTNLDGGLFIGTEHEFVRPEWPALPLTGVHVEHRPGHVKEVRISWKDPASIAPRSRWDPLPYEGTLNEMVEVMNDDLAVWATDWPEPSP